ncbi:MAG: hypothetical protein R3C49_05565 [Planctomycetaceae bacterium]
MPRLRADAYDGRYRHQRRCGYRISSTCRALMSKKQVILMSLVTALPAAGLLAAIVLSAVVGGHGGNMFSGLMTVVVSITGLLVLMLSGSPFLLMAWYPKEGFGTPMVAPPPGAAGRPGSDDDGDEGDGQADQFDDDDGGFDDDGFDDGGFEEDSFEDEYEEFDDEEWS